MFRAVSGHLLPEFLLRISEVQVPVISTHGRKSPGRVVFAVMVSSQRSLGICVNFMLVPKLQSAN
jgi:hypothetical protein